MLIAAVLVLLALIPAALYYWKHYRMSTPSLQWPILAPILKLQYLDNPPRLAGDWHGRSLTIEVRQGGVRVATRLSASSRLRIEIGPKEEVVRRAGMVVPDPVQTEDREFNARLLARCSDKAAGAKIVDPALRQRLMTLAHVDILGQGDSVYWTLPAAKDPDTLEAVMDILTVIASEMEHFPA